MSDQPDSQAVRQYLTGLQETICQAVSAADAAAEVIHPQSQIHNHATISSDFITDRWDRAEGGGGIARVLGNGRLFEKAGVNFSHVFGEALPPSATRARPELAGRSFEAMGVSLVLHPENPHIPTTHANVRFFQADKAGESSVWWFGGGFDLTPYYPETEDCVHWHSVARQACDTIDKSLYPRFKKWCDEYFYLPHRQEARGIGGLFFDDFNEQGFDHAFALMRSVGDHFLPAYLPIVQQRQSTSWTAEQKKFQLYRRGRYVEFNLVYDRGTLFGLQSGGRTESILMSLPPKVNWEYDWQPQPGTQEALLYTDFLPARDWV